MKNFTLKWLLSLFLITSMVFVTNAQCDYTISLEDSYGDGWNGGSVTVLINGEAVLSDLTFSSGYGPEVYTFSVNEEDTITTTIVNGSYPSEMSYFIKDSDGIIVAEDGTSPTGISEGIIGTCPSCPAPTGLDAADITPWEATLSWLLPGDVDAWNLQYGEAGFELGTVDIEALTNNWTAIEGLTPSTDYEFYVQAECTEEDASSWRGPFAFSTIAACPQPTDLSALDITATTATLVWNSGGSSDFHLVYGPYGFNMEDSTEILLTDTFYMATDLENIFEYQFYVKDSCGEDTTSLWSGPYAFTTLCGVYYPDYMEEFSVYNWSTLPACWSEAQGTLTNPTELTGTYSSWSGDGFANDGYSGAAKLYMNSSSNDEWLISPTIDLGSEGNMQLEFDLALTASYNQDPANPSGLDDKFIVVISPDNGETWNAANTLRAWQATGPFYLDNISHTGDHVIIDLSLYTGEVKIGLYGESTVYDSNNEIFVDNFRVRIAPSCNEPSGLYAENMAAYSADLSWTELGTATAWNIELVGYGEDPTGTATQLGVTNPYTYDELMPETTYEYYVQSDCGEEDLSLWSGPYSFTTDVSCPAPTNLSVEEYTATTALFTWETGGASAWNIEYGDFGFTLGEGTFVEVTDTFYSVTDLTAETTYHFYVQDSCAEGDESVWVGPISVTTTASCPEPMDLYALTALPTEADLSWSGFDATNWDIEWGESGFAPTGVPTIEDTPDNPYNLTDLIEGTEYDFYVRSDCGSDNTDTSAWAGPYTFKYLVGDNCSNAEDLSLLTSPYDASTTGYTNDYNFCSMGSAADRIFFLDVETGFKINMFQSFNNYDSRHTMRTGGDCPGDTEIDCIDDNDYNPIEWVNATGETQRIYWINSGYSSNEGDFTLTWELTPLSTETEIVSFGFPQQSDVAEIDSIAHTVSIFVAYGTDLTNINPFYTLSEGANTDQTTTDYSSEVIFPVTAEDGVTIQDWTINVFITPPNTENDFLSYSIPEQTTTPVVIDTDAHTVLVEVGNGTDPDALVASFEISMFATINIDDATQISNYTPNTFVFDTPLAYNIVAEDGTVQVWNVTVTEADIFTETDILSFVLPEQTGEAIIDPINHTVTIEVNWEADLSNLNPIISYSYGAYSAQDTTVDFTDPKTYTVFAEDEVTNQDWTITITIEDAPEGAFCWNAIPLTLPAENIMGDTEGFGDNYNQDNLECLDYYMNGDDIVYEFTLTENGYISGDLTTTNSYPGLHILDGCPDDTNTTCIITAGSYNAFQSFENQYIEAGTYYYIISSWPSPQNIDFDFNINFVPESEVEFIEFDIPGSLTNFLSQELDSVHILMPMGTDLDSLVAEYVASEGATISVGFTDQESGVSINNWASNGYVYYNILGEDGITLNEYIVVVEKVLNDENEILEYTIADAVSSEILDESFTINVVMPEGTTNLSGLIAEFTVSDGAVAKVDGIVQTSTETINNWTEGSVVYTVVAENGDEQTWTVNVTVNPYTGNEILEYSIPGEHTKTFSNDSIYIMMNEAITDISVRVAEFTLSDGATAYVNGVEQESALTENDFSTLPVPYTVIAENGDTKTWIVLVTLFVGIDEIEESSEINVYPNPNNGQFNLKLDLLNENTVNLEVVNVQGQVVANYNDVNTNIEQNINLEKLATGVYYLKVYTEKETFTKKVNILK